jgi:hypothetical protein
LQLDHAVAIQVVWAVIEQCNALAAGGVPNGAFAAEICETIFQLITNSIAIFIDLAIAITIEYGRGVEARIIILLGSFRIVIASILNGATHDFFCVANTVAIYVDDAISIAVVSVFVVEARTVVVGGIGIVVAGRFVLASSDFKFVTDSITVGVG